MEDLIFSTLVGIMTTVGMSLVMYQPKPKAPKAVTTTIKTETVKIAPTVINNPVINEEVECDLWDTAEVTIAIAEIEPVETIEADETAEIDKAIAVVETTLTLVSNDIDLDKLPVTICKKVAGKLTKLNPELKISQSVNGASKPVSQLRAEIKNKVAKEPEMVMAIIKDAIASESKPSTKKPTTKTTKRNLKAVS